ncbi:MAG TPA: molybdopterin-dependent oxidoreductase [bacterium]|nr:molybdopterin-dependent oxidoreductase [bacterium]
MDYNTAVNRDGPVNPPAGGSAHGFGTGAAAGAAATLVLFAFRFATGSPTPVEALAERLVRLLPYPVFAFILAALQHFAKPLGFVIAVATSLIGFGVGGMLYVRAVGETRWPRPFLGLAAAAVTWVSLTYIVLPIIEGQVLGVPLTTVISAPALPMAIGSLVYGFFLATLNRPKPVGIRTDRRISGLETAALRAMSRRDLFRRSALILLVAAAASRLGLRSEVVGARVAAVASGAAAVASAVLRLIKGMPPEVTPNGRFYQVSKNYPFDPTVDVAKWSLQVKGLVAKPLTLPYAEFVRSAPSVERYQTLECISNEVGGDLIGNARWKGIRVRDILALTEIRPGSTAIVWHSADGYFESVPLAVALDPESLLAYEMNGAPLPQQHGAPVRVLLPNRYGTKQPKWLTGIEAANSEVTGYWEHWQHQRFGTQAIVKTSSAFSVEVTDGGVVRFGGWAFAGSRGIARVELSADRGETWFQAAVKDGLAANTWQFWSAEWTPPAPGEYALQVRAVDGSGMMQRGSLRRLPDGAEGYHEIRLHVGG